jgi:hypothetical protein
MHFDLTNFLSGLAGALLGGFILWLGSLFRGHEGRSGTERAGDGQFNTSIILAVAFILGVLIALYFLISGQAK